MTSPRWPPPTLRSSSKMSRWMDWDRCSSSRPRSYSCRRAREPSSWGSEAPWVALAAWTSARIRSRHTEPARPCNIGSSARSIMSIPSWWPWSSIPGKWWQAPKSRKKFHVNGWRLPMYQIRPDRYGQRWRAGHRHGEGFHRDQRQRRRCGGSGMFFSSRAICSSFDKACTDAEWKIDAATKEKGSGSFAVWTGETFPW